MPNNNNEKKTIITQVLVMVLKGFKKFFNDSTMIQKIWKVPYQGSKKMP